MRRRPEFQQAFEKGTRVHGRFFTMLLLPSRRPLARLGIVASKKLGGAVERNRAKRLIREVFRLSSGARPGGAIDAIVIPRRELLTAPFSSVDHDFRTTWRRGAARLDTHAGH